MRPVHTLPRTSGTEGRRKAVCGEILEELMKEDTLEEGHGRKGDLERFRVSRYLEGSGDWGC